MAYRGQRRYSSESESSSDNEDNRSVASSRRSGGRQTARPSPRAEVFRCSECLREFTTRQGLNCHITTTHERARASRDEPALEAFGKLSIRKASDRFACSRCDKDYSTQGNLNRHIREHHGQRAGASSNVNVRSQTNIQNNVKIQNNYFYLDKM